ncbi:MAG: hypothetical protein U0670_19710 [Anaerolineae bacterium]
MVRPFTRIMRVFSPLWQLHPPVGFVVGASRSVCLQTLITAARPSQNRLHLRDVFVDGRRYAVQPRDNGFRITTSIGSRRGGQRRRTRVAGIVIGSFLGDDTITLVRLRYQAAPLHWLASLLIPAFIASIVIYADWHIAARAAVVAALFLLSWLGSRLDAAVQVAEIVFFVQKALEDLPPVNVPELAATVPGVVMRGRKDFAHEWEKFYETHRDGL